ncbi:MAG TPA: hypothetical protein VNW24_11685 [Stellaceae bacterium]|jgi:hypothetical protein|nr:hypothetical protein [Stellaceae bacterium]
MLARSRFFLSAALAVSVLVLVSSAAFARVVGDSGVAYSADRALSVNGQRYDGVLYAMPGFQRHEQTMAGMQQVAIFNLTAGRGYFVVPSVRTYIDFPIDVAVRELSQPDLVGAPLGTERQGGVVTTKYRVDHRAADGTRIEGFVWLAASGIPMRGEGSVIEASGKRTPVSWTLSNVHVAPQDPGLFQPPDGFYRLPAAALPGILGGAGN